MRHHTVGDVLNAWSEVLLIWGCRWGWQLIAVFGVGCGIGLGLTLAWLVMIARPR